MGIEEKLQEIGIKRVLVVDDSEENLAVASRYFHKIGVDIDLAFNRESALEMLKESQVSEKRYDLVISDLEMETKDAGMDVVRKALETITYPIILTGRNYNLPDSHPHGPNTAIIPAEESVKGKKSATETWEIALEKIVEYLSSSETQRIYNSARRYQKHLNEVPNIFVETMLKLYEHPSTFSKT
ncbi:response regulator [Patescibacteria group bacterium]|nr:response regulator [Patescibacteria group bacterium]